MKKTPKISESEWQIMKTIWEHSPQTANEIIEALSDSTKWNPKTIKTLINRLVNKGALDYEKNGKVYSYFPIISKSDCIKIEKRSIVDKLYDGELNLMLKAFIEDEEFTDEEINELTEILRKKAAKHDNIQ